MAHIEYRITPKPPPEENRVTKERIDYPVTGDTPQVQQPEGQLKPATELMEYFRQYTRERPDVVALWCLGIGFVLGWKVKPW